MKSCAMKHIDEYLEIGNKHNAEIGRLEGLIRIMRIIRCLKLNLVARESLSRSCNAKSPMVE